MRDVFCLATFVAKVLCLVVFFAVLKPSEIRTAQAPSSVEGCKIRWSVRQRAPLQQSRWRISKSRLTCCISAVGS